MPDTNGAPAFTLGNIVLAAAAACTMQYGVRKGPGSTDWVVGPFTGPSAPDAPLVIESFEIPETTGMLTATNKHLFVALVDAPDGLHVPDRPAFTADAIFTGPEPVKYGWRKWLADGTFEDGGGTETITSGQHVVASVPAGTGSVSATHGTPNFSVMVQPD